MTAGSVRSPEAGAAARPGRPPGELQMPTPWVLTVRAHAKINLSLRVMGRRPDGDHELKTVFQSLALHDRIEFRLRPGPFALACDDPAVPTDERNLVCRAAALVWRAAGRLGAPAGVEARLVKRIPAAGGLGGGSADGAAALVALDLLWKARLSRAELDRLAARLGADVPYFLVGGTTLGLARGDELYPLRDRPAAWVALVLPPFGVSTAEAFGWADGEGGSSAPATAPWSGDERGQPAHEGVNDLERVVARRHPQIRRLTGALRRAGAEVAAMSGSGSTVYGLFAVRAAAEAAARRLGKAPYRAIVTRTLPGAAFRRLSRPTIVSQRSSREGARGLWRGGSLV